MCGEAEQVLEHEVVLFYDYPGSARRYFEMAQKTMLSLHRHMNQELSSVIEYFHIREELDASFYDRDLYLSTTPFDRSLRYIKRFNCLGKVIAVRVWAERKLIENYEKDRRLHLVKRRIWSNGGTLIYRAAQDQCHKYSRDLQFYNED